MRAAAVRVAMVVVVLAVGAAGLLAVGGAGRAPDEPLLSSARAEDLPAAVTNEPAILAVPTPPTATPVPVALVDVAVAPIALAATPTAVQPTPVPPTATLVVAAPTATAVVELGPPRVGLQVGHWRIEELPDELSRLRGASGGAGGGRQEWEVNLEVAEATAERLRALGYEVDILPATVPPYYKADIFISIHADANASVGPRGYKVARGRWSRLTRTDDRLVQIVEEEYGAATGLPRDYAITRNMTGYYAFNNRRRSHAVDITTPAVILEMGYLTNPADRSLLFNRVDLMVDGITRSVERFLEERPPLAERERPATVGAAIVIKEGGATVRAGTAFDSAVMTRMNAGRRIEAPEIRGDWFGVWVVEQNQPGWVHASEADLIFVPLP